MVPTAMKRQHDHRAVEGIFVGSHERTGSSVILTPSGAIRGGRIQRKPDQEAFSGDFWKTCRGLPWDFAAAAFTDVERVPGNGGGSEGSGILLPTDGGPSQSSGGGRSSAPTVPLASKYLM